MTAYPLEQPLSDLSPARRVYIVRRGWAFLYPDCIVKDIANDLYTMDDDRPWSPRETDWACGRLLADQLTDEMDLWEHGKLKGLARTLWSRPAPMRRPSSYGGSRSIRTRTRNG